MHDVHLAFKGEQVGFAVKGGEGVGDAGIELLLSIPSHVFVCRWIDSDENRRGERQGLAF